MDITLLGFGVHFGSDEVLVVLVVVLAVMARNALARFAREMRHLLSAR